MTDDQLDVLSATTGLSFRMDGWQIDGCDVVRADTSDARTVFVAFSDPPRLMIVESDSHALIRSDARTVEGIGLAIAIAIANALAARKQQAVRRSLWARILRTTHWIP